MIECYLPFLPFFASALGADLAAFASGLLAAAFFAAAFFALAGVSADGVAGGDPAGIRFGQGASQREASAFS